MIRRHSGSAIAPKSLLGSPRIITRVMPSGYVVVKLRMTPKMTFDLFSPYGRSTSTGCPFSSRSNSTKSPGGNSALVSSWEGVIIFTISYG